MSGHRNWICPMCHERGDDADSNPLYLDYETECCLSGYEWFREGYPQGMKHHWANGTPLSIGEARLWQAIGAANEMQEGEE